jgi:hypothetical protein
VAGLGVALGAGAGATAVEGLSLLVEDVFASTEAAAFPDSEAAVEPDSDPDSETGSLVLAA